MGFAGVKKDSERANLIAYLRTLSDNPVPLPEATAPAARECIGPGRRGSASRNRGSASRGRAGRSSARGTGLPAEPAAAPAQ